MKKNKKIDLKILIFIPILTALTSLFYRENFLISTILFFGAPALYLAVRHKNALKKTCIFSLLFSVPLTFIFDYLIAKDQGWYIVNSIFPFRIFNIVVVEQFIWAFLWVFYIVIFYEYFLDKQQKRSIFSFFSTKNAVITKQMEYFALFIFALLLFFIFFAFFSPTYLRIDYSYLVLGTIFGIIPLSIFLFKFPNFFVRFSKATLYFIFLAFVIEYVGLKFNHWTFPGTHFIGMTNFFGFLIPYEEIMIYFVLSTPVVLSYYEFFDDDRR